MLGQSYGMLNNRAANEYRARVLKSEWKHSILLCSLIHDAIYKYIKDDVECVRWANTNLVECMQWQKTPDIAHDTVKLGGQLGLFHPNWATEIELKNGSTADEIAETVKLALAAKD